MKILLVDDEPLVLDSAGRLLRNLGFDVHPVDKAEAILQAIRHHRPCVVIQDVRMPGLDLAGLIASVRADPEIAKTRVVLCSASMEVEDVAARVGADDWLEKPYSPRELASKVSVKSPAA